MIRQLRRKMVATAMVSLFVVLTVILCAIHWVNYQAIVSSSDGVLDILGANRGMFPRPGVEGVSPEMPYEARYFSVLLNPQGQAVVVEEEVQSFRGPALAKDQSLNVDITPMLTIQGDEGAVRQLVSILLDNAVKYAPEGGQIQVQVGGQGRFARLSVSNSVEQPIPPQQLAHFFDRFYRGDGARSGGGFGIGLSVAAAIVSSHRGKIEAVSATPGRLEMVVLLPMGK